ncbi:unnamed protein product [Prorocentrum cordatum]|uniref:Uncharacterized protein n=1 Tax=Prorocentrum cordatum TaxID=2364126 RepID=A0ABN9V4V2_9DINO|nr:unnamed protein product [Polarella glacialis]
MLRKTSMQKVHESGNLRKNSTCESRVAEKGLYRLERPVILSLELVQLLGKTMNCPIRRKAGQFPASATLKLRRVGTRHASPMPSRARTSPCSDPGAGTMREARSSQGARARTA